MVTNTVAKSEVPQLPSVLPSGPAYSCNEDSGSLYREV